MFISIGMIMLSEPKIKFWLFVLWISVIFCALSVVHVSNACRALASQLSTLEGESNILQEMRGKYLLEKSSYTSLINIEKKATDELQMRTPRQDEVIVIFP